MVLRLDCQIVDPRFIIFADAFFLRMWSNCLIDHKDEGLIPTLGILLGCSPDDDRSYDEEESARLDGASVLDGGL